MLRDALHSLADEAGILPYATRQYPTLASAMSALAERRSGYCSLLLCSLDYLSVEDQNLLHLFKERLPQTRLVIVSADPATAMLAYQVYADAFVLMAKGGNEFRRVMQEQLNDIVGARDATITLKTKDGIDVLDAGSVLFAETSNAGPIIHLANGQEVQLRGTLQALFEQMSHDERFAKAGGSFIVNLDNVRSAGKSSVVFPDGSLVIIPIRARKPFQDALSAYRAG